MATRTVIQVPVIFCNSMPSCGEIEIPFPFGVPPFRTKDPCCDGLQSMGLVLDQLDQMLKPLYPFLRIMDCVTKLVDIVIGIPKAMGPPPSAGKIITLVRKVTEFASCVTYLGSLAPPGIALDVAKMVRGILQLLIALLTCLRKTVVVQISIQLDALTLARSTDSQLVEMGACLKAQGDALGVAISTKCNQMGNLFNIINLVVSLIPGLPDALGAAYPIKPFISVPGQTPSVEILDELLSVLGLIYAAVNIFAGG